MEKVKGKQNSNFLPQQMELLLSTLSKQQSTPERIALPTQSGLQFIVVAKIMYCLSDSNYTEIHLEDGSQYLVSKTLKDIESLLPSQFFIRIHHSHLINTQKISRYVRGDGGYVVMDDGKNLNVSRSRKEALLAYFG